MTSVDVVDVYTSLENVGVEIWIDGGWGVDAAVSRPVTSRGVIIAWHKEDRWRTSSESACNKRTQRQKQTKPY
jgi:hypothetical protein